MAGLGEACSHIAALLFSTEAYTRHMKNISCTSNPCEWLPPTMKNVPYAQISDINFSAPSTKRKKILLNAQPPKKSRVSRGENVIPSPSEEELKTFFDYLSQASKPVVLSYIPEYSDNYVQGYSEYSPPISLLYDSSCLNMQYDDLLIKCASVFCDLVITEKQANNVEVATREQTQSKMWFRYRTGRITASRFKAAVCTDMSQPSLSLIKSICYPESYRFSTCATNWGCDHEKTARQAYQEKSIEKHLNLTISDRGLVIHKDYPHLGASPDGYVKCACCGCGVIEVKCPFACRNKSFLQCTSETTFCLEKSGGYFSLKHNHAYYYQVQLQMKLCMVTFCDFVMWREDELVIIRIDLDEQFVTEAIDKATTFFKYGILPEIVAKWYTRETSPVLTESHVHDPTPESESDTDDKWCYCGDGEHGEMIGCDGDNCKIKWFHIDCLKIPKVPKGVWYCPDCRKNRPIRKKKLNQCIIIK